MGTDRLEAAFAALAELPPGDRHAALERLRAGDAELARQVADLLRHAEHPSGEIFPALEPPSRAPGRIGPYELTRLIGAGGMGTVHLARREDIDLWVAIKRPYPEPSAEARFYSERRILAQLRHPGIARLLDAGVDDGGIPYLVMEFVDGLPIDRWCDARGLSVTSRAHLLVRVCEAVAYAHAHAVVHHDLKPANVLVDAGGEPKVLDFGLASLPGAAPSSGGPRMPLATPAYAAPEQLRGEPAGPTADVYSLGVILHELLTGTRPDLSSREWPPEQGNNPLFSMTELRVVGAVVSRCLAADPSARYPDADALRSDLLRALATPARPRTGLGAASRGVVASVAIALAYLLWPGAPPGPATRAPAFAGFESDQSRRVVVFTPRFSGDSAHAYRGDALRELVVRGLDGAGPWRSVDARLLVAVRTPPF
ncbi:MAG TPA: serine/threonine-protein kinase [Longimicrobium sp.]